MVSWFLCVFLIVCVRSPIATFPIVNSMYTRLINFFDFHHIKFPHSLIMAVRTQSHVSCVSRRRRRIQLYDWSGEKIGKFFGWKFPQSKRKRRSRSRSENETENANDCNHLLSTHCCAHRFANNGRIGIMLSTYYCRATLHSGSRCMV